LSGVLDPLLNPVLVLFITIFVLDLLWPCEFTIERGLVLLYLVSMFRELVGASSWVVDGLAMQKVLRNFSAGL
jgi:hypothetical protein